MKSRRHIVSKLFKNIRLIFKKTKVLDMGFVSEQRL